MNLAPIYPSNLEAEWALIRLQKGKNSTPAFLSADSEVSLVQISGRCISDPGVSSWNSFTAQSQSADVTVRCAETLGRYVVDLVHLANRTLYARQRGPRRQKYPDGSKPHPSHLFQTFPLLPQEYFARITHPKRFLKTLGVCKCAA